MSPSPAGPRQEQPCRYVAIGEGLTEGVGDPDRHLPNGVRGWADRFAEGLAAAAPGWQYANLAVRGRRLASILAEQLPAALELRPVLVSLTVGTRDVLVSSTEQVSLRDRYETAVSALTRTGATVVLFTHAGHSIADATDERTFQHNDVVRRLAAEHGAVLVDPWDTPAFARRHIWEADRLHLSPRGHARLARHLLDVLRVAPENATSESAAARSRRGFVGAPAQLRSRFGPSSAPQSSSASERDRAARWPVPVEIPARGGLRSLGTRWSDTRAREPAVPWAGQARQGDAPMNSL